MDNGLPKELSDGGAEEAGKGRTIDGKPLEDNREQISNIVGWNGPNDPENPQNWPFWRKATITFCVAIVTFFVTFASSVLSPATVLLSKEYGVSVEVTTFSTSLFVLVSGSLSSAIILLFELIEVQGTCLRTTLLGTGV